jgi:transcriptional regulator with XRE-family HTH domain
VDSFAKRFREELARNGIKQKELAQRIGVTEASLSRYANGFRTPRSTTMIKIAEALHITPEYLMGAGNAEGRPEEVIVEFIESYITGGIYGSNYQWRDNHGEIVRCRNCAYWKDEDLRDKNPSWLPCMSVPTREDFFCSDGKKVCSK